VVGVSDTVTPMPPWVEADANFSDPQHRVWLRRGLGMFGAPLGFILHNPSVAAADRNDPTVVRCVGFGHAVGASDVVLVNAATGVATDADDLADMVDPIGPEADHALMVAARFCIDRGGMLVAAWGAPKGRAATRRLMRARFDAILRLRQPLHALRLTKGGDPEHPLYLPAALRPVPWNYLSGRAPSFIKASAAKEAET